MALEGLHHVTAITGHAPRNVDFYARLLGLRLVKKTVNFDQPDVYHLYFGDERGTPGSILTFFEFPGAVPGVAGAGMVHTIRWRVGDAAALDFWVARLGDAGVAVERAGEDALAFADFEGLRHELLAVDVPDAPLAAHAPGVPDEHALRGFHGVRAHAAEPARSAALLGALGFTGGDGEWRVGGERHAELGYDAPPEARGRTSAGTVHHVAW
jgi:glyoxalase family protein